MAEHLRHGAASAPEHTAAILTARARNGVLVANVDTSLDENNENENGIAKLNGIANLIENGNPNWNWFTTILHNVHNVAVLVELDVCCDIRRNHEREDHVDANVGNQKEQHNLEGRHAARLTSGGSCGPVQAHASHDLADGEGLAPPRQAQSWMAASMDTTVTDAITPGSDRHVVPIPSDLADCPFIVKHLSIEALAFLDASFGLSTEEHGLSEVRFLQY